MSVIGEAFVAVRPETTNFGPEAEKGVLGSVSGIAKKAAGIFAGAFAVKEGVTLLKDFVTEGRESNKVAAQSAQVIKTTGGAARVSAKDVDNLANSISRKTGIDDEQIASSENLLLTFTNVRNETGKGNDIFNRATQAITDMSAVQGDLAGNARLVGKALNDPAKGMAALQRVGVRLSEQQQKQVKDFLAAGDAAKAQGVILDVLKTKFGGQAEAQATAAQKLHVVIDNVKEQIGKALIPIIDRIAGFLADRIPGAIDALGRGVGRIQTILAPVIANVQLFWNALRTGFTEDEGTPIEAVALTIRTKLLPVLEGVVSFVRDHLKPILISIGVLAALIFPTAFFAALALAYVRFKGVRDVVDTVVAGLRSFVEFLDRDVRPVVERVAGNIADGFGKVVEAVSARLAPLAEAVGHIIKALEVAIAVALAPILLVWAVWGDQIKQVVGVVFDTIKVVVEQALRVIGDVIDFVLALINGDWGKAWHALEDIPKAVFTGIKAEVTGAIEAVATIIGSLPGKLSALGGLLVDAGAALGGSLLRGLGKGIAGAVNFVSDIGAAVLKAIKDFINKQVIDRINRALEIKIKGPGFLPDITLDPPDIPHLARGAIIRPKPGGTIARIAEAGRAEAVLPLPDGLLAGLTQLAVAAKNGLIGNRWDVTLVAPPERNVGRELIAELAAVQYLGVAVPRLAS